MTKEQKFYKALQDVFIGAKIEGTGGFINLMRIKSNYYRKIEDILKKDIESALKSHPKFRDELFDKLYSFFSRYFTESGSIYFNSTPFHNNIYEKVYTDDKDVILFWKTQMLYYIKTDRIFKSMPIEFDNYKFYFDATTIETKKANEKRSLIYELKEVKEDKIIVFNVYYSEKGRVTQTEDILKDLKKKNINIDEETLERAFRIFEKQSEVDFFINKNAKAFLQEQFKLWSYQYFWEGAKEWNADRVNELQILKDIAFKIIDFISQFEDELVKIWNKPKFVKNSNYVITLDKINNLELIEKIFNHPNINEQIKEWQELRIVDDAFKTKDVFENDIYGKKLTKKYEHLPIDTKYFKDLEFEILSHFEDLDNSLDGWLIKSENYQALNTILPKFKEKVQTIYIDPPFNLGKNADYFYNVNYKDASWLTLLENRYQLAKDILARSGSIFTRCDDNGNMFVRLLMNYIFGEDNFRNEIIIRKTSSLSKREINNLERETETLYHFCKVNKLMLFNQLMEDRKKVEWVEMQEKPNRGQTGKPIIIEGQVFRPREGWCWARGNEVANDMYKKGRLKIENGKLLILLDKKIIGSNWTDITGYTSYWHFNTENSEKMLKRVIELTSNKSDLVLDYFVGIGSSIAVAHKLSRKWIGIDMGDQFYRYETDKGPSGILVRMKEVLAAQGNHEPCGISKDTNWQGGGFFKYYELEQYEETLANTVYENHDLFIIGNKSPYEQYVFMKDEKMLRALEVDYENKKVNVDLSKIYPPVSPLNKGGIQGGIDIAETLSNLTGKWIKKITPRQTSSDTPLQEGNNTPLSPLREGNYEVEFEDGSVINTKDLDYTKIKQLIWWE